MEEEEFDKVMQDSGQSIGDRWGIRRHEDIVVMDCKRVLVAGCTQVVVLNTTDIKLIDCLDVELDRSFFTDTGSEACR